MKKGESEYRASLCCSNLVLGISMQVDLLLYHACAYTLVPKLFAVFFNCIFFAVSTIYCDVADILFSVSFCVRCNIKFCLLKMGPM